MNEAKGEYKLLDVLCLGSTFIRDRSHVSANCHSVQPMSEPRDFHLHMLYIQNSLKFLSYHFNWQTKRVELNNNSRSPNVSWKLFNFMKRFISTRDNIFVFVSFHSQLVSATSSVFAVKRFHLPKKFNLFN